MNTRMRCQIECSEYENLVHNQDPCAKTLSTYLAGLFAPHVGVVREGVRVLMECAGAHNVGCEQGWEVSTGG